MNTPVAQLSNIPSRFGHLGRATNTIAPSKSTAPNMRRKRKVSGCAYGSPSFAPINPDAHRTTNKPGAATIVKCSIGVAADWDLSDVMRMECVWNAHKGSLSGWSKACAKCRQFRCSSAKAQVHNGRAMEKEGEPTKPWDVWRLDGPNGRRFERIAEADTREELETKYKRRLDSH
jgi:hypothetical protein